MKPQSTHISRSFGFALALVSLTTIAGCYGKPSPSGPEGIAVNKQQPHDHIHEQDFEALATTSISFAKVVQRLPRRIWVIPNEFKAGHRDHAERAIHQLTELVSSLPALAADTDLDEADWITVSDTCHQMSAIIRQWSATHSQPTTKDIDSLVACIERLKPLAEQTRPESFDRSNSLQNAVTVPGHN